MEIITLTQVDFVSNAPSALSQLTCEIIISLHLPYKKKVISVIEKMLSSYNVPQIKLTNLKLSQHTYNSLRKTWHKYAIKIQTFLQNAAL